MKRFYGNKYISFSRKEYFIMAVKSLMVMLGLDYVFYRSLLGIIITSILGLFYFLKLMDDGKREKRNKISMEFKEMLLLSGTGQRAGYSVENSIIKSYEDLQGLFGDRSVICRVVKEVYVANKNHQSVAGIFERLGKDTGIEDIIQFGEIYQIAYSSSGNMSSIMDKSAQVIMDKIDIRNEAYLELNERIFEFRLMNMMPFLIIIYVSVTNPGYFDVMYHNIKGMLIMTLVLGIYALAYGWGYRMLKIEI